MLYKFQKTIEIREGEYFRGGVVAHGLRMPIDRYSEYFFDVNENKTDNQVNGLFVSTQGRYIYAGGEYSVTVKDGRITVASTVPVIEGEADGTLKGAYLAAMKYAKTETSHNFPRGLLKSPQFCTWVEMGVNVSQKKILSYADRIVDIGFSYDLLIIDDGWSVDYGDWRFNKEKIPEAKKMLDELHKKGFRVSLWIVPFVNKSAKDYETLMKAGAFVRTSDGEVAMKKWWNGTSAVLDLTSPAAKEYLIGTLDGLVKEYNVDGFKFDAGDERFYSFDDLTYAPVTPAGQCSLYSEIAKRYEIAEVRSGFLNGGAHMITRLGDKRRSWDEDNGIRALVPNMIQAGLCCYPFSCADMIGGGNIVDFDAEGLNALSYDENGDIITEKRKDTLDNETELAVRFCQCNALMPAMQFSCSYWDKSDALSQAYKKCVALHESVGEYLDELITNAIETGEPILRCVEYEFPHQGFEKENDAFFLGEKYYVIPVIKRSVTQVLVRLPEGAAWKYCPDGVVYRGGTTVTVDAGINVLPYFERLT